MSDLDKTIEELEAEVKSELEEKADPKKGAAKGDAMEKPKGEVQDLGPAVVKGDEKDSGPSKADDKMKKAAEPKAKATKMEDTESEDQDKIEEEKSDDDEKEMSDGEMIKAMTSMMKKMNGEQLAAAYDKMEKMNGNDDEDDKEEVDESTIEDRLASVDVSDDVNALTSNEELSEEFKNKAKTVFEAAIKSKLRSEIVRMEEEKSKSITEEVENVKVELTEKVDNYMNYVVEEWMKENEIALERGLKGEISEDFISGLKALFEEHYIDVPDEKYDILESQAQKIEELEGKLNDTIGKLTEKKQSEDSLVRESVIKEVSSDLAETQTEKFASLVEDVEFTDKDSFTEKLNTLKENYFPKSTPSQITEENEVETQEIDISDAMAAYTSAIKRSAPYMKDANAEPFKNVKN
jgi:small-conductance mechanosensitive channel